MEQVKRNPLSFSYDSFSDYDKKYNTPSSSRSHSLLSKMTGWVRDAINQREIWNDLDASPMRVLRHLRNPALNNDMIQFAIARQADVINQIPTAQLTDDHIATAIKAQPNLVESVARRHPGRLNDKLLSYVASENPSLLRSVKIQPYCLVAAAVDSNPTALLHVKQSQHPMINWIKPIDGHPALSQVMADHIKYGYTPECRALIAKWIIGCVKYVGVDNLAVAYENDSSRSPLMDMKKIADSLAIYPEIKAIKPIHHKLDEAFNNLTDTVYHVNGDINIRTTIGNEIQEGRQAINLSLHSNRVKQWANDREAEKSAPSRSTDSYDPF